ncbi:venom protein 164-like [Dreissena polymorpha]|uniref:Uncharacterized protein n=1 Tax=Dreissena polymorpha TaxID=45954 RepID=A0A9D4ESY5_DREPO|nr:venom protein 164-like [Dreissena polymorpha]KAH3784813.1 hypothetical protein DPMN_162884 [Dreissena polymorpha]
MEKTIFVCVCILATALCNEVCSPGDDSTCPAGHCCVRESLVYIPEYTGPRPPFQISCRPFRQRGEFCYHSTTDEMCPCDVGLTCATNGGFFGHCA